MSLRLELGIGGRSEWDKRPARDDEESSCLER